MTRLEMKSMPNVIPPEQGDTKTPLGPAPVAAPTPWYRKYAPVIGIVVAAVVIAAVVYFTHH